MSKFNKIIEKSKLHKAMLKHEIKNKLNENKKNKGLINHYMVKSGRFYFPRFTKIQNYHLESFYVLSDLNNPTAIKLYLYLLRNITGYEKRESIEYKPKKIKKDLNIGNSFYRAIECLKKMNLIYLFSDKYDNKYVRINVFPDTWDLVEKDREIVDKIVQREINDLLGIKNQDESDDILSLSSSSYSSSSSSSMSLTEENEKLLNEELLKELDGL